MSCSPCNCEDCQDEHYSEAEDADFEEYVPSSPPARIFWSEAEPANEAQAAAWMGYINEVYDMYPGVKAINMPAMISLVAQKIPGLRPENYASVSASVERFIRESPAFELRKGKSGGVFRKEPDTRGMKPIDALDFVDHKRIQNAVTKALEMSLHDEFAKASPEVQEAAVKMMAVQDNYTCKGCGNTKLHDTNDKSCWSCGRVVGT